MPVITAEQREAEQLASALAASRLTADAERAQRELRAPMDTRLGQTPIPVPVPLAELAAATAGWAAARKVGEGGFGVVYRADALPSRPVLGPVAIKRLGADSQQGLNELMSEVQLLGTCRHEHLLPLLAFCYEGGVGCLVYPLMAGGRLEDRLVLDDDASRRLASLLPAAGAARPPLTWQQRRGAARQPAPLPPAAAAAPWPQPPCFWRRAAALLARCRPRASTEPGRRGRRCGGAQSPLSTCAMNSMT
jgi:hypothetical protein